MKISLINDNVIFFGSLTIRIQMLLKLYENDGKGLVAFEACSTAGGIHEIYLSWRVRHCVLYFYPYSTSGVCTSVVSLVYHPLSFTTRIRCMCYDSGLPGSVNGADYERVS